MCLQWFVFRGFPCLPVQLRSADCAFNQSLRQSKELCESDADRKLIIVPVIIGRDSF